MVSDTMTRQNFPPFPPCQVSYFEHFQHSSRGGALFIFWTFPAAAEAPSTSFLFIITNYQFVIFHIAIQFAQQSPQKLPSFQLLSSLPNLHLIPIPALHHTLYLLPSPGVHFPLTKIFPKYTIYPLLHAPTNHSFFHSKYLKMA